MDRLERQKQR